MDKQALKPILELYERARNKKIGVVSDFLSPDIAIFFEDHIKKAGAHDMSYHYDYGFSEGERGRLVFYKSFYSSEDMDSQIGLLKLTARNGGLEHRSILGSILGLGIVREKIGDITVAVDGFEAKVAVDKHLVPFFLNEWCKVGHEKIVLETTEDSAVYPRPLEEMMIIVSSYRLDAVISKAYPQSRSEGQEAIVSGRIKVNHRLIEKTNHVLSPGDLISYRGKGRFKILSDLGMTKKDRYKVEIGKYI